MLTALIYAILGFVLVMLTILTYQFSALKKNGQADEQSESTGTQLTFTLGFIYTSIVLVIILLLLFTWYQVRGTPWEGHLMEWLNIVIRLMHVTFGIAWIGASFYFVFLENALNRNDNIREELAGNLWAVHGGGFYYLEKYKTGPAVIPQNLHWFKYEAYFTWLSGFSLLFVVYYFNATALLIDSRVLAISPGLAIALGISSFGLAWLLYDALCKSKWIKNDRLFGLTGFALACIFAFGYSQVFSSRAAYIHFGAMLGTLMAANVFFIIIPSQKAMVKAAKQGKLPDPALGKNALIRSIHNNYFTLPVLFVMISNHFPSTFGNQYPWAILAGITLGTAGVKHYLNLREKGHYSVWVLPVSVIILLTTAFITAPPREASECSSTVSIATAQGIIASRCINCHSHKPTDKVFTAPPNGIVFDTPDDMIKLKDKILQRAVLTRTMPPNNQTGITEAERDLLRCWIDQGALK